MRDVSIKQIRAFLAVASTHSFAKAAKTLNVSASALSLTVQQLEQSIAQKLFERTTRAVALTEAGAVFLPIAERLIADFARAVDDVRRFPTRQRRRVCVGSCASVIKLALAPAMAEMYNEDPQITLCLYEDTTLNILSRVTRKEIDFGITTLWTKVEGVEAIPLLDDRLGLLTAQGHPLSTNTATLPWSALRGANIATLMPGAALRARIERDVQIGHVLDQPFHEVSSVCALAALVEARAWCSVVPALTAESFGTGRFIFRPLVRPTSWRTLYIIMPKGQPSTPIAHNVIRIMIRNLTAFSKIVRMRVGSSRFPIHASHNAQTV